MKSSVTRKLRTRAKSSGRKSAPATSGKIHPVVVYPYRQPDDYSDLKLLYQLIARLNREKNTYERPITVIDRKTHFANEANKSYREFRRNTVARHSDILDAWGVDTCQMWYTGFGEAFERGGPEDVYWLIPGDFNYGTKMGHEVLSRLPEICQELQQDLRIGDHNHFNLERHFTPRQTFKQNRSAALAEWSQLAA